MKQIINSLAQKFLSHFPDQLSTPRTIGREAEYPVVDGNGEAVDLDALWKILLRIRPTLRPKFDYPPNSTLIVGVQDHEIEYSLEVGRGTIEVIAPPFQDLFALKIAHENAISTLMKATSELGFRLLGYGIQPITPPSIAIMSPKQRYSALHTAVGDQWHFFTVTASDQIHVSICKDEMIKLLNFGNLMSAVIVALCGNSPIYSDRISPFCSAREGLMSEILPRENRHGMTDRPFSSVADLIESQTEMTFLVDRRDGIYSPIGKKFAEYLAENGDDFEAFKLHDHYVWQSARLRVAHGTIEIRPACQQPWAEHWVVSALSLGLIESADQILNFLDDLFSKNVWQIFRSYHHQAITDGLSENIDLLNQILIFAREGLDQRNFGEAVLLEPLFDRLNRRENPAQITKQKFNVTDRKDFIDFLSIDGF